jgi:Cu/Ag efflux pump CusA
MSTRANCADHDDSFDHCWLLIPLVLAGPIPGQEIEHPMATVILGGLVTSTLLNLLVVPVIYLRFGKGKNAQARVAA